MPTPGTDGSCAEKNSVAAVSIISTRGLSKHYSGLTAVSNVDFDLPEGQIRALIGPNGAGKTTFVGMLSGRIKSSAGSVHFNNTEVTDMPAHKRMSMGMAYTFQITSIFANLSVHENVALAARRVIGGNSTIVKDKVLSVLRLRLEWGSHSHHVFLYSMSRRRV